MAASSLSSIISKVARWLAIDTRREQSRVVGLVAAHSAGMEEADARPEIEASMIKPRFEIS